MMKIKQFTEDISPSFDSHELPKVHIPSDVQGMLSQKDVERVKSKSLEQYRASKISLEQSIADVAVHDKGALDFAGELSERVLTIMDVAVELGLAKVDGIDADKERLLEVGVPEEHIDNRPEGFLRELKQNAFKTKIISESGSDKPVEMGNVTESGFVGFSPLAIKNATKGSLRERMYIPYKSTHGLTKDLFAKPENVVAINRRLEERGVEWRLNKATIDTLRAQTQGKRGGLYAYGAYAAAREGSRVNNSAKERLEFAEKNPTMRSMQGERMPLSQRELLAQSGDLDSNSNEKVQWLPGAAWCRVLESRDHPTLKAADETGDQMITGISGTTDSIMTLGHMIGMFDGDKAEDTMRSGMVALMGWMVDAKDHTAHEILTSGNTFGLDYTPGPDSYKQIRPGDDDFLSRLRLAQEKRGFRMPDEYLSEKNVQKLAAARMKKTESTYTALGDKENVNPNVKKQKQQKLKASLKEIKQSKEKNEQISEERVHNSRGLGA